MRGRTGLGGGGDAEHGRLAHLVVRVAAQDARQRLEQTEPEHRVPVLDRYKHQRAHQTPRSVGGGARTFLGVGADPVARGRHHGRLGRG